MVTTGCHEGSFSPDNTWKEPGQADDVWQCIALLDSSSCNPGLHQTAQVTPVKTMQKTKLMAEP